MVYIKWLILFPLMLLTSILSQLLNPIVALFITSKYSTNYVRIKNTHVKMRRTFLCKYVYWFQPPDAPVDEYYYGGYYKTSIFKSIRGITDSQYNANYITRYLCRVLWLSRNSAYGFAYNLFGSPLEVPIATHGFGKEGLTNTWFKLTVYRHGFHARGYIKLLPRVFNNINFGWKHLGEMRHNMYASRIIGIRIRNGK